MVQFVVNDLLTSRKSYNHNEYTHNSKIHQLQTHEKFVPLISLDEKLTFSDTVGTNKFVNGSEFKILGITLL